MNLEYIQSMVQKDGIIFLSYGGFLSQTLIAGMTEALEKEAEYHELNMGTSSNIFTIFIELSQNVMNYSKNVHFDEKGLKSQGLIVVGKDNKNYYIHSQNIVTLEDKEKIENNLSKIVLLSKDELKEKYKQLRRSGRNRHEKGAGIGFYEVAKRSDEVSFEFKKINETRYYFHFISKININKD